MELGLADLIHRALVENYQIQLSRNMEQITDNGNTRGNAGMLPVVDFTSSYVRAINNSRQEFFTGDSQEASNARRNSFSAGVEARWVVFDGMAMFARKEQLEQLATLSEADTRFLTEQTVADLVTAYYQLRQETELLRAFRESLEVSKTRLSFAERASEIGTGNRLDVHLAQVDVQTDSAQVLRQQARIREITVGINQLINRELTGSLVPTDSIRLRDELDLDNLLAEARNRNASLQQRQLAELIALTEVDIRKGALYPEVELYGSYDFNRQANQVGFLQSSRTFGPEYGLRVRFNLFSGQQEQVATENAELEVETERLRTQDLRQQVEASLRIAYLRWENSAQEAEIEKAGVVAAEQALTIARRQYELGELTNVDFRAIQLSLVNAETRFLSAQLAAKIQEIELLRLSGGLLEELL